MSKRNFDHTATESMAHVRRFDSLGEEDLTLAGGKGVNLGELVGAGFPIPSGFVVTTDVYRALTDEARRYRKAKPRRVRPSSPPCRPRA